MGRSRTRPTTRQRWIIALLAALAVAASACGDVTPAARVAQAAEAATAHDTARFTVETELTGMGQPGTVRVSGDGEIDFAAERMRMTLAMDGAPEGFEMEMLVDGPTGVTYTRNQAMPLGDDVWLRTDPADLGVDLESLRTGEPTNPITMLEELQDLATDIEEAGEDEVRGEPATRYRMTFDYAAALEAIEDEESREAVARSMAATGVTEIPAEVWVDERDRVVRVTQTMDLGQADPAAMRELAAEHIGDEAELPDEDAFAEGTQLEGTQTVTMEFHDFGADVDIEFPEGDDVLELHELDEALEGMFEDAKR